MANRIPMISLKTATPQAAVFTPQATFTPQVADMGILREGFREQAENLQKGVQQQSLIKQAFGEIKTKLHQDEETAQFIDNMERDVENKLNAARDSGDFYGYLNLATSLAGDVASNAEIKARIKHNQQYEENLKLNKARLANHQVTQNDFDFWVANNPCQFKPIKDSEGRVIGGEDWNEQVPLYDSINWDEEAKLASDMTKPESYTYSGGEDKDGKRITEGSSYVRVKRENLNETMSNLAYRNNDMQARIRQAFLSTKYKVERDEKEAAEISLKLQDPTLSDEEISRLNDQYESLELQINNTKKLFTHNGSPVSDANAFYINKVLENPLMQGLSYNHKTYTHTETNLKLTGNTLADDIANGKVNIHYLGNGKYVIDSNGPLVGESNNTIEDSQAVDKAANNIMNSFNPSDSSQVVDNTLTPKTPYNKWQNK